MFLLHNYHVLLRTRLSSNGPSCLFIQGYFFKISKLNFFILSCTHNLNTQVSRYINFWLIVCLFFNQPSFGLLVCFSSSEYPSTNYMLTIIMKFSDFPKCWPKLQFLHTHTHTQALKKASQFPHIFRNCTDLFTRGINAAENSLKIIPRVHYTN